MHFITPYLLTYLSFLSFSYLIGTYAFIHKDICDLYQISKTQLGFFNGIIGLVSTIGVILFLMYSAQVKAKIVTYFAWGSIGYMLPYALIVLSSLVYDGKAPKVILYFIVVLIGFFRSIFFQSLLIMLKMHKEIYDKTNKINQHNFKLLTNIWSASYGMVIAFFTCNWLEYQLGVRWEYQVLIGVSLKLVTTTLIFFGLREYLQDHDEDEQIVQSKPKSNNTISTFSTFFGLINEHLPSKLFLINSTIMDALHIGFCYALPVFFYDSGYKGSEGYLTAIYSLSIIVGAYVIALSDFFIHKAHEKMEIQNGGVKKESKDKAFVMFIFSISLFFFVIALIVISIMSFQSEEKKKMGIQDDSNMTILMLLMCALGFFFGGPLKSYFSYKSIKAMGDLEKVYEKKIKCDQSFKELEQNIEKRSLSPTAGFCQKLSGHKLQVGTSLITTNRILTYFATVLVFIISFYLIDNYLGYSMLFFTIIGISALVFDIIQNWVAVKEEERELKESQEDNRLIVEGGMRTMLKQRG